MSSTDESDEEFESADEDIDFDERPQSGQQSKCEDVKHLVTNIESISVEDNDQNCEINKNKELIPKEETNELSAKEEIESKGDLESVGHKVDKWDQSDQSDQLTHLVKRKEIESKRIETDFKSDDLKTDETIEEKSIENESKEQKTVIKGRKLLRKADRIREQTATDGSDVSEEKIRNEVLNKLSDLSDSNNTSKWNHWFTDIKCAAMSATSTTVSHMSEASNSWSFDPKSLLSGAVTITSSVGTGISSVVGNVSQAVDSAIGAPPPEQMAALLKEDQKVGSNPQIEKTCDFDEPNAVINEKGSHSGFGLFDYTLNTLESIGKKTIDVIVDDKRK